MSADLENELREAARAEVASYTELRLAAPAIECLHLWRAADALSRQREEIARLNAALDEARAEIENLRAQSVIDDGSVQQAWQAAETAERKADEARATAIEAAAKVADERAKVCADAAKLYADHSTSQQTEVCAGIEAAHIAKAIRALSPPDRSAEEPNASISHETGE